jgi:hypothetical protein
MDEPRYTEYPVDGISTRSTWFQSICKDAITLWLVVGVIWGKVFVHFGNVNQYLVGFGSTPFEWTLLMKNTRPFAYLLQRMISFRGAARSECWLTLTKITSSLAWCNWYFVFHVSGANVMNDLQFQAGQQVLHGCHLWHQCIVSRCVDQISKQNSVSVNRALA